MSQNRQENTAPPEEAQGAEGKAPGVRFSGIVEAAERRVSGDFGYMMFSRDDRRLSSISRQVWLAARLTALFVFFSFVVGLPLGNWFAHFRLYGTIEGWNPLAAYGMDTIIYAFVIPALLLVLGYSVSQLANIVSAAESIAAAAQQFVSPDADAIKNVETVGTAVQTQMDVLNEGLDGALTRLASVEAMIRQHVEAIEIAGEAIELRATGAVTRVADERSRLMELTESLNAHADSFAAAIAEKAKASIEAMQSADKLSARAEHEFEDRLSRLEDAAARALSSFEALRDALREGDQTIRASAESIDEATSFTMKATERAANAANAAAESAARNAANVAASASRASEEAKKAADAAIGKATEEAERMSREAVEAAARETSKVREATSKTMQEISATTKQAVDSAAADAAKATKAAEDVSGAARKTSEAAAKAASEVAAASDRARKSSEAALKFSENEAVRIEERNKALAEARAALEKENERLESLIEEQRKRADRLAEAIASQTERLSRLAEAQLREQEAAARLAQAQNEMQARADRQAAERKKIEAQEAEQKRAAAVEEADRRAAQEEAAKRKQAEKPEQLELDAASEMKTGAKKAAKGKSANGASRLEELARDIAERRPRRGGKEQAPIKDPNAPRHKGDVSWREILDAAEDAEPLDLGMVAKNAAPQAPVEEENAIRIIAKLQDFTYNLETRLYGDPPPALQERFDRGDRNVFANRLLRLNESDVKRRIRTESGRDKDFEHSVHEFLQGFERLLEDATTSETADEDLEEYLSSPLGRVYLLIGATVGYFA